MLETQDFGPRQSLFSLLGRLAYLQVTVVQFMTL